MAILNDLEYREGHLIIKYFTNITRRKVCVLYPYVVIIKKLPFFLKKQPTHIILLYFNTNGEKMITCLQKNYYIDATLYLLYTAVNRV